MIYRPNGNLPKNTFASCDYRGAVKLVKTARACNEVLAKKMAEAGITPAEVGSPCPYRLVEKSAHYVVSLGSSLHYDRKTELRAAKSGVEGTYTPDAKNTGMFPILGELLYVKNDLSCAYVRTYLQPSYTKSGNKELPTYYADGKEINILMVAQWLPSETFNVLSGGKKKVSYLKDEFGAFIYAVDENGDEVTDSNGEKIKIPLPEVRSIKVENCTLSKKGEKIEFFSSEVYPDSELIALRDKYNH